MNAIGNLEQAQVILMKEKVQLTQAGDNVLFRSWVGELIASYFLCDMSFIVLG